MASRMGRSEVRVMTPIRHFDVTPAERERRTEIAAERQRTTSDMREWAWCALYALGGALVAILVGALT
jgi:hypothetical protein